MDCHLNPYYGTWRGKQFHFDEYQHTHKNHYNVLAGYLSFISSVCLFHLVPLKLAGLGWHDICSAEPVEVLERNATKGGHVRPKSSKSIVNEGDTTIKGKTCVRIHNCHYAFDTDCHACIIRMTSSWALPRHWPLCGEFTGDRWIPRTKGQ